jgi:RND family efflux transporter MFP subunit
MTMKRIGVVVTGLVGAALVAATALQARGPAATPVPAAVSPATPRQVAAEGRVVTYPGGEVVVAAERGGRLVRVLVEEGDAVRKGDLVAEIDSDELRASLGEARARVSEAEAEARLAAANRARRESLAAQQILSSHDLDEARRDVETAEARVKTARATVARYEAQIRQTRVTAPIAGTVILRHVQGGETVESGKRVVTLADLRRLRIEAEADEADAAAVAMGALTTITADGFPGRSWKGRVEEIPDSVTLRRLKPQDPARATDTRVLAVKVAFAEPTPLKLGTTVELRIAAAGR